MNHIAAVLLAQLLSSGLPIAPASFTVSQVNVAPVAKAIGSARIIGLGEGSHGTSEFYAIKDALFRYLVKNEGITVIAVEGDWSEWTAIDSYIQNGEGSAAEVLNAQDFAIYKTREMADAMEWLRSYNLSAGSRPRVHVVGIDFQEPVKTFSFVEAYAKRYLRALMPDIDLWHGCLSNYGPARCDAALTSIRAGVAQSRPASQGQLQAQRLASHALEILERGRTLLDHRSFAQRDRTMAANVQWIAQTLYPNARIIVSAHDDHVCTYDPHWPATMGTELRKLYGNAYYALGMTFGSGTVRAHRIAGGPFVPVRVDGDTGNTTAALFNSIDRPFFLNIDAVTPGSALAEWLNARQTMWMPGGVIFPENVRAYALGNLTLSRAFDSLIFVPASHATTLL